MCFVPKIIVTHSSAGNPGLTRANTDHQRAASADDFTSSATGTALVKKLTNRPAEDEERPEDFPHQEY